MENNLEQITKRFYKFNKMAFDDGVSTVMAKILVEKFGFTDKKYYTHVNREVQMFDWKSGQGTLFLVKDGLSYKYEIGKIKDDKGNLMGWFCPDIEEYIPEYYHGVSFGGSENKKMTFMLKRKQ